MAKRRNKRSGISIIVPIHEFTDQTKVTFDAAVASVKGQKEQAYELIVVVPKDSAAHDYLSKYNFGELNANVVVNDGKTDFASQMNFGVSQLKSEWFTILEYDDELAAIWLDNVVKYRKAYPETDIFLPFVVDVQEDGAFIGLTNEAVWAQSFSDELGVLDNQALLDYQNFNIDGLTMTKERYEEIGGFKANIKLTFIYEFLLRATFKALSVMVIPKFGYKHVNQREGSLFSNYKFELNPIEANWWLEQAKREYFHTEDREITYEA